MLEVQDIFQQHGAAYLAASKPPTHIWKAAKAIGSCRTSALGGHVDICDECGYQKISYNSCRNRHCPKCQALSKERWILARSEELLPVPYFHVVFTLPDTLNTLSLQNQRVIYDLLLKASAGTIMELASGKKYLGAQVGITSILHTWGQSLTFHPHVHMVVPGGGLTKEGKWVTGSKKFFLPVKVMAKKFRGKFLHYLSNAELRFEGEQACLQDDFRFRQFLSDLYQKDWYVYCKRPFKTTNSVLQYLGRYTHRVAISNHRLVALKDGQVTFKWRDYRDDRKEKRMTLATSEFMRRFLLHILPPRFTKIRHYGLLASAGKKKRLAVCRKLTGVKLKPKSAAPLSVVELMQKLTGKDISLCPACGIGHLSRASPNLQTA
jgi:hypothetical protein